MLFSLVLLVSAASADLSTPQLLELQRIREHLQQHVRGVCGDASCVRWDARLRVWRFARSGVLTSALPDDGRNDPSGNAWTDAKLVHFFPELAPTELALNAMSRPVSNLWMALVRWLAEDPRRLDAYGPPMWNRFLAAHRQTPHLQTLSPWGRPYAFEDFVYLGMTADALRTAVTLLRCETPAAKAIEIQRAGKELTPELLTHGSTSGALAKEWLVDAWGTPLRLHRLPPGSGQLRMGATAPLSAADTLRGWQLFSAGPDRKHGGADDLGCGDARRVEGPARLTPYGYRPLPRGPHDQAIDDALIQRANEELIE
ncbi:hypothetical protein ATI61_101125 [Archangium gephyra]|uniref:Uncharacterized protein n=1 Tax=Archangium gephyra TaxID=48 RepID=A0AAC8QCF5_9BACT|nr:hypothetical protein [Archangium gephyra]AKJ04804.1 Hypothetical protein AA314_06430 [Archangium gephyra]REG37147.1 hypothetical protein ATI61_101125 [Archangium gephyra]